MGMMKCYAWLIPVGLIGGAVLADDASPVPTTPDVRQVPVVFTGGYETDPRDRGRPVILVASALGVRFSRGLQPGASGGAGKASDG